MKDFLEKAKDYYQKLETTLTARLERRETTQELVVTLGGVAIVLLIILVVSFAKPVTEQLNQTLFVEHYGEFNYQADARRGIYDQEFAETGEPFFWDISDELQIEFTYRTNGVSFKNFTGSYQLTARLEDEHGWNRSLELGDQAAFTTYPLTISGTLVLDDIAALLNSYQRLTGVSRNNYFLVIEPHITVAGTVAGMNVQSDFSPELRFYVTTSEFYLVNDDQITLQPEYIESVTKSVEQGGTLSLFSLTVPVKVIRWVSLILLLITSVFLGIFANFFSRMLQREDPEGLAFRYGEWIVTSAKKPANSEMSLLSDFNDLVKMANQYDLAILYSSAKNKHYYYIKAPEGYFYYLLSE